MLTILTLVYALGYVDRVLVLLLLQPIKLNLHLTDAQLGFITGLPFGLFYSTVGLLAGARADRSDRVTLASLAIGVWGLTVMACMFVRSFAELVVARAAAAVGEAGCMPPTYSILGDYFPGGTERVKAMGTYCLAGPLAMLVGLLLGGYLNDLYGWRDTFAIMGAPGLVIAVVARLTIKEPRTPSSTHNNARHIGFRHVLLTLWLGRASRHLCIALILLYTAYLGLGPWYVAFLIRAHGMQTSTAGLWLGLIFGFGGAAGVYIGSFVTRRWLSGDEGSQVRLSAALITFTVPCLAVFLLAPEKMVSLLALIPYTILCNFLFGPIFAVLQRLSPDNIRASVLAIVMLLANVIGMGVGPEAVGFLSDYFARIHSGGLRDAMLLVSATFIWAAWHMWLVGRTVRGDLTALAST